MTIATWGDLLVKKEYKMTMPILQNRYYTLSVAGTMGRNSVVAMLGNYMVIGRLKNNTITFKITDFTAEDTIVLICPEGGTITHAQLERGNKATDWTPSPEDFTAPIKAAQDKANAASEEAIAAQADATIGKNMADNLSNDSVITQVEKLELKREWDAIVKEKPSITIQATDYGLQGSTEATAYNTAYNSLNGSIPTILSKMNEISPVNRTTFNTNFANYYDKRQLLLNRIAKKAKELADVAQSSVDNLEIGGRNLVLNTKGKLYRTFGASATLSEVNGATRLTWSATAQTSMGEKFSVPLIVGETYTLSFEARGTITTPHLQLYILATSGANLDFSTTLNDKVVTQEFRKYTATFKFTGNPSDRLYIGGQGPSGTWLEVKDATVKLEKGNKATDWSPAPEDAIIDINKKTYNPVRYIRDWTNGSTANTSNHWFEIQAIDTSGNNIALGKTVRSNASTSLFPVVTDGNTAGTFASGGTNVKAYMEVDLGSVYYNISEIKVWRYYNDGRTYYDTKTEVSEDGNNWYPIFDSKIEDEYAETSAGRTYPNTQAKSEGLLSAYHTTERLESATSKVVINGGNITAGRIQDSLKRNNLNLDNGTFEFANGNIKYDGTALKIKTGVEFGALPNDTQTKINAGAQANTLTSAWVQPGTTQINGNNIRTGTLDAKIITTGTLSSKNNYSKINLDDGTFSFGNGRLVWNGSDMTVNGKISVSNINGDIPKSKLASAVQTEISSGVTAKSTLDSKARTWDAKETTSGAQAKANTAEANAKELASAMAFGKMLYTDPIFKYGLNSINPYNNSGGKGVTIDRIAKQQNAPTDSTHILRVTTSTAATSPGLGGFTFSTMTSANKTYITRFVAKIPSGRSLTFASNAIGDGGNRTTKWLSSNQGTGRWEEYVHKVTAGDTGGFSSTNFFYISGGSKPLTWYIAYATVFDVTDDDLIAHKTDAWSWNGTVEIDGGKIRAETIKSNQIAAGSITADKIVMGTGTPSSGNLAAGRTFSGSYSGTLPGNGNNTVGTSYASFGVGGSNNNRAESAYIQVDLGSTRQIAESRIFWYAADRRRYYYKIKYSTNGSTWFYAVGNSNNNGWTISKHPSSGSSGSYEPTIDHFAIPITARYLRIYGNGSTSNTGNHIYEWELYSKIQTTISGGDIVTNNLSSVSANLGTVTAGIIRSSNSRNEINLNNGNFSLGNGQITYNNSTNVVSISAKNIDLKGKVNFDAFDSQLKTTVNNKVTISNIGTSGKVEIHGGNIKANTLDVGTITGDKAKFLSLSFESLNSNMKLNSGAIRIQNSSGDFATMNTIPEFRSQDSAGTAAIMGKGRSHYYSGNQNRFYIGSNLDGLPQYGVHIGKNQTWGIYRPTNTSGGSPAQYYNTPKGWGAVQVVEELMRLGLVSNNFNTASAHIRSLNGWGNSWPVLQPGEPVMYKKAVAGNSSGVERIWTMGTASDGKTTRVYSHVYHVFEGGTTGTSDRRLKHDIEPTQVGALRHIESLAFKEFRWNKDNKYEPLGLIAQDSGIIRVPDDEMEGYDIQRAIMLGLKGVQELQEIVKEQAEEIKRLKEIIDQ